MTHTNVLFVTTLVSHFVSAGMASPFHIHVLSKLWRNSIKDCSSGVAGWRSAVPVTLICSALPSISVTLAGDLEGNLSGTVRCLWYFSDTCPSVLAGK